MVINITILSVLEPLLYFREAVHLAEISRRLKSPHVTVRKHLNNLEREGIVTKSTKGRLTLYKLNYSNPIILDYLAVVEKNRLIRACQKEIFLKETVSFIHENFRDNLVVIFGSFAEDAKKVNDIDVLITGVNIALKDSMKLFEKKFGMKFHIVNVKNLEDINQALKEEIMKKHLIISDSERAIEWMLKN